MLPVRQRVITPCARIFAIVQRVVEARASVEEQMLHGL
jgi:hypothetical protein